MTMTSRKLQVRNMLKILLCVHLISEGFGYTKKRHVLEDNAAMITMVDLTKPTNWKDLSDYQTAVEKHWKLCINCGIPGLGTAMHLDLGSSASSMYPAFIPTEYLLTRLSIIDVSSLAKQFSPLVLSLDVALQWIPLKSDPKEPTLLLFKFGSRDEHTVKRNCVCKIPGLSYELADWIAANLSHVVGVATDGPTLESEQTREFSSRTITNLLGKSGIYMIENVNLKRHVPDKGCMTIAMPLMLSSGYVPTRLTAFCPSKPSDHKVMIALKKRASSRVQDINLDEIMN